MIDYIAMMQKYYGERNDGFLTDAPSHAKSSYGIEVRYDAPNFRWVANRPSGIVYPKAKQLIEQFRREYAARLR